MKRKDPKYKYNSTLLIDDSDLDNFINEKMLEATQFSKNIHVSTNGEIAFNFVNNLISSGVGNITDYPDVIFVDLNMPVMNGFEFIENFKKLNDPKLMQCKIIILTSSIDSEDKIKAEKIDSRVIFVNKPLTKEVLNSL